MYRVGLHINGRRFQLSYVHNTCQYVYVFIVYFEHSTCSLSYYVPFTFVLTFNSF